MIKNLRKMQMLQSHLSNNITSTQIRQLLAFKSLISQNILYHVSTFDAKHLRQRLAQIEFKTLQKYEKNQQVQDLIFDIGYRLESETQYKETERNLILLLNIGDVNLKSNQVDLAQEALQELIALLNLYDHDQDLKGSLLPQAYKRLGMIHQKKGDLTQAHSAYSLAIQTIEMRAKESKNPIPADDIRLLISLFEKLGNIEKASSKQENALDYYKKAHNISKQLFQMQHPFNIKITFLIGDILRRLQKDQEALEYLQSSLNYLDSKSQQNVQLLTLATNSAVLVQLNLKDIDNALVTLRTFEQKTQESKFLTPQQQAQILDLKGIVLRQQGKDVEAKAAFNQALEIARKIFPEEHDFIKNIKKTLASMDSKQN